MTAALNDETEVVKWLISVGAVQSLKSTGYFKRTALEWAHEEKNAETEQILVICLSACVSVLSCLDANGRHVAIMHASLDSHIVA